MKHHLSKFGDFEDVSKIIEANSKVRFLKTNAWIIDLLRIEAIWVSAHV